MKNETIDFLKKNYRITAETAEFVQQAEKEMTDVFSAMDEVREYNQFKVLKALQDEGLALRHFAPTTGYGYDDIGRDTLDRVFAAALDPGAERLGDFPVAAGDCVIIGNEGHGLSDAVLSAADRRVFIPMSDRAESFNAAVAASLLMWEFAKGSRREEADENR